MRLGSILREAALNLASGTTKAALFGVVLALLLTVLGGAEIATVARIDHDAREFRDSGGSTLLYRMKAGINAAACDTLRSVPGVSAAGAARQRPTGESAAALPSEQIPTYEVSSGFGGFRALGLGLGSSPTSAAGGSAAGGSAAGGAPAGGVLISEDLAQTTGARAGGPLPLTTGSPTVSGVYAYPSDGRQPGYGYAIFAPADSRAPFDECWVEAWPITDALTGMLATTLMPGAVPKAGSQGQGPQLQQLNASHGTSFDGAARFADRITQYAAAIAAVVGCGLGFTSILRRKLELAAARHAGVGRAAQTLGVVTETLGWALLGGALAASALGLTVGWSGTSTPHELAWLAARVLVAGVPASVVGSVLATLLIRERALFAYFRSR